MSRLSSESWQLLLRHDAATLVRRRSGLRKRLVAEHRVLLGESSTDFSDVCERSLPGLREAMGPSAAGASLSVLVGDMWTRVRVIEGDFHRLHDRQIDLMAEASLQELLDHSPARSDYRWQIQRGGRHLFASAVMPGVAERASHLAADLGLGRVSVSTRFAGAWNDAANPMGRRDSGVFAVVDGPYAAVAWVSGGIVAGITQGGLTAATDALDRRVERDLAAWAVDSDADLKYVLAGSDAPAGARWQRCDLAERKAP